MDEMYNPERQAFREILGSGMNYGRWVDSERNGRKLEMWEAHEQLVSFLCDRTLGLLANEEEREEEEEVHRLSLRTTKRKSKRIDSKKRKVIEVACVACGCGDEISVILRKYGNELSLNIQGLEYVPSQVEVASDRFKALKNVTIIQGDAVSLPFKSQIDVLLCIDGAYHFKGRKDYILEAGRVLNGEEGVFGLVDLAFDWRGSILRTGGILPWLLENGASIPRENQVPPRVIQTQVEEVFLGGKGWKVEYQDMSDEVFPGFREYTKRKGAELGMTVWWQKGWIKVQMLSLFLYVLWSFGILKCICLTALSSNFSKHEKSQGSLSLFNLK